MHLFTLNFKFNSALDVSKTYITYSHHNKIVKYINVLKASKDRRHEAPTSTASSNEDVGAKRNYCYLGHTENSVVRFVPTIYYV